MSETDHEVTAQHRDGPVPVTGTDHVTIAGSNAEDTVAFYRDLLGMPLVMRQPNLDDPEVTHLFFDTGDGRLLTVFVEADRESNDRPSREVGNVHHLAFSIDPDRLEATKAALDEADKRFSEYDRGAFHSLYTTDNNGLTIELVVDKFAIPDDRRGEVLALAHAKRVEAGADFVGGDHVESALDELGIDAERRDLADAPAGTGYGGD